MTRHRELAMRFWAASKLFFRDPEPNLKLITAIARDVHNQSRGILKRRATSLLERLGHDTNH